MFNTIQHPQSGRPPILLFGDPHSDFRPIIRAVKQHKPIAVILLGDLTPDRPLHLELQEIVDLTEVWFIHGNHDTDSEVHWDNLSTHLVGTQLDGRNLHGRVVQISGLLVAGLGGVFRGSVWDPRVESLARAKFDSPRALLKHMKPQERWRNGVSLRHRSSIFPSEIKSLAGRRADLLVSHEAPSFHDHGFSAVDQLAQVMQVRWLVHGHHHADINYQHSHRLRMPTGWPALTFGVDRGSFLALPQ